MPSKEKSAKKKSVKKKPAAKAAAKKPIAVKKSPRPQELPGMEDRAITALENKARDYADVRDQRMQLSKQEHELQEDLLKLMKKYDRKTYRHGNVLIEVVPESEKAKVKIKKASEAADEESSYVDEFPGDEVADETDQTGDEEPAGVTE